MGNLKKRKDGRYCRQIRVNGKVVSFYGKSEREINRKMLEYKRNESEGAFFREIAQKWERQYLETVSYTTYKKCGLAAFKASVEEFGDLRIKKITAREVDLFLKKLAARGYAQKTVATYKSILNQIFKYALINGYADTNPAALVSLPKNLKKSTRTLPSTEDIKIINTMTEGFGFLAYFLLYTGLRMSEARALEYNDIDWENRLINVNKKIVDDDNNPILRYETKTEAGTRQVILLDRVADLLPKKKNGIIFCNEAGGYLTKKQLQRNWDNLRRDYNLNVTAHQLRHAYATMLYEAGINEKDAQDLMGHSDIRLTHAIYTHIRKEHKAETAEKLNNFSF